MSTTTQQAGVSAANLPYTCNTCLVAFHRSDAQRDHMRKDWHLYNMKRRIASLPPVSLEVFNEKVIAAKANSTEAAAKASFEKTCHPCQKTFYSENSYQNHIKSSKHKQRETRLRKEGDDASVLSSAFSLGEPVSKSNENEIAKVTDGLKSATIQEEDEDVEMQNDKTEFSVSRCLFCLADSADAQANVEHMYKTHGMFVPEQTYLVDLDGLLNYLYRKITENHECLYCHAIRNNAEGARTHMRDKGHCMIAFEAEEEQIEIGQYYDFRSTYSDGEDDEEDEDMADAGGVKVKGSDGDDDGWETDASSVDDDDEIGSRRKAPVIYQDEYELHLPSGRSIGHRSLAKYYRQNLHSYPTADERAERQLAIANGEIEEEERPRGRNQNRALITRANGGTGMIGATDHQKQTVLTAERRERTRALRSENRYHARLERANNSQKHFRDPLLQ
ncbi:Cytoplasmic 60S subunit biogenesis factor REI1 [Penicillium subrubescens]|uniref:Cytoplasmic 60S subunit biogenesis factor REI1-like protein n=1 Tax=Penicillium subrubescens TaxID=1316194 RepID=A0A1Q5TQ45_9EURO|nr:Cytoplasmic 60S subunit biogenesis factor REI1 [Penicillium subrubescens]KAJ5906206.1 Cytoplasmic 60S subunit biogenesis factor REI1 [Penicillium subrubescens]OKP02353.1 Cytoplasmic 60S subunit biogenesis factor REI1 -like protein [Penicillium subrubescens]